MIENKSILCSIPTKGRYHSTLPMVIEAISNQTKLPDKLIIVDDNDEYEDIRNNFIYSYLFNKLNRKGVKWEWLLGNKKGQHHIHQMANTMGYDWVWRVDDDVIPESNVLEELFKYTDENVGAIGGSVLTFPFNHDTSNNTGKIEDICLEYNTQWGNIKNVKEVEHLHCSFLYRAGIYDYNLGLSRVAFREETLFSYGLYLKGYKLLIVPNAITWHLENPNGGVREEMDECDHDDFIFKNTLDFKNKKMMVFNCDMKDKISFFVN
jgi:GT2 family glycosyltransferase